MKFVWLLCWLSVRIALAQATSHWMVTETGLVQPKEDSPFLLENSFHLLSFINQDLRWENIFNMYYNLIGKQQSINQLWTKLENDASFDKHISENKNCEKVGNIDNLDWYTSFLEDARFQDIPEKDYAMLKYRSATDVPDCKKISSLTFSMFAFEHLDSMIYRENLNATPEYDFPDMFASIMTVDQFGHWVSDVLRKNSSSWLHYNLAAIYWRVKGFAPKALECSRRAVHYAPRQFKSIALLCMGTILHRSRQTDDAAVVLGASVDHDPKFPISHFALGGALAVIGDFNSSLKHLDLSIELHCKFDLAEKFRSGVLCHLDMFKKIQTAQSTLKELSKALKEYIETEMKWLKFQTNFLKTMKHADGYDMQSIESNCIKMSEITGLNIKELKKDGDRNSVVQYFIDSPTYNEEWKKELGVTALDTAQSLQRIIRQIGAHAGLPTKSNFDIDVMRNSSQVFKEIGPPPAYADTFLDSSQYTSIIRAELRVEHPKSIHKLGNIEVGTLKAPSNTQDDKSETPSSTQEEKSKSNTEEEKSKTKIEEEKSKSNIEEEKSKSNTKEEKSKGKEEAKLKIPNKVENGKIKTSSKFQDRKIKNASKIEDGKLKIDTGNVLYPSNLKVNRNKELFDTDSDWPGRRICSELVPTFPSNVEAVYPVFMPFENKGIKLDNLLTERLGVPASVEYELPWHPPVCPIDKDLILYTQRKGAKVTLITDEVYNDVLRTQLLKYLGDSHLEVVKNKEDAEIGHRIYTAIEKKMASKWVLYTVASLYWRVRRNIPHALNCLLTASRTTDTRYRDVVLVSLASVFIEMGFLDECATHMEEAFKINSYEPATNFMLAQLNMIKKNYKSQLTHLKQVIRVEGQYMGGIVRNLVTCWGCILKEVHEISEWSDESETCGDVEPGVSMICDLTGFNCHIKSRHCNSGMKRETSQVVRMLELKDDTIQGALVDDSSIVIFDKFIDAMPSDRTNKAAHQKNYDGMMKAVQRMLKGCGAHGCNQLDMEDNSMKEEDCTYENVQFDYWLQIISFGQQLGDTDMKLPAEIAAMQPSKKEVPECWLPPAWDSDFYLERIMRVDTRDWEPILSLMHQFTELFSSYDYSLLGAKISRYIETRPNSWVGLIAAGWWCGASGRGPCATRCLAAAHAVTPPQYQHYTLRPLAALLHMQSKGVDAKDIAYLSFYTAPKSKIEAFLVAISHSYRSEYEQAVWMFLYALTFDKKFLPARACLHMSMCFMRYGDSLKLKANETPT